MIAALGLIAAAVLSLLLLIARGLLTDELKGRIQQRTRAHLDATLDALAPEVCARWEEEWRAELAAKLGMPVTAWQLVHGIRATAAELVAEPATATAAVGNLGARRRRATAALSEHFADSPADINPAVIAVRVVVVAVAALSMAGELLEIAGLFGAALGAVVVVLPIVGIALVLIDITVTRARSGRRDRP